MRHNTLDLTLVNSIRKDEMQKLKTCQSECDQHSFLWSHQGHPRFLTSLIYSILRNRIVVMTAIFTAKCLTVLIFQEICLYHIGRFAGLE